MKLWNVSLSKLKFVCVGLIVSKNTDKCNELILWSASLRGTSWLLPNPECCGDEVKAQICSMITLLMQLPLCRALFAPCLKYPWDGEKLQKADLFLHTDLCLISITLWQGSREFMGSFFFFFKTKTQLTSGLMKERNKCYMPHKCYMLLFSHRQNPWAWNLWSEPFPPPSQTCCQDLHSSLLSCKSGLIFFGRQQLKPAVLTHSCQTNIAPIFSFRFKALLLKLHVCYLDYKVYKNSANL